MLQRVHLFLFLAHVSLLFGCGGGGGPAGGGSPNAEFQGPWTGTVYVQELGECGFTGDEFPVTMKWNLGADGSLSFTDSLGDKWTGSVAGMSVSLSKDLVVDCFGDYVNHDTVHYSGTITASPTHWNLELMATEVWCPVENCVFGMHYVMSKERQNPDLLFLTLTVERSELWANGHENVEVVAQVLHANDGPQAGVEVMLDGSPLGSVEVDPPWPQVTDQLGEARFLVSADVLGTITLDAAVLDQPEVTATTELMGLRRHVLVFVQGIDSMLPPESGEPVFATLRDHVAQLGFVRPARGAPEVFCDGVDDDGDGAVDDGCPLVIDYSYYGGFMVDGEWFPVAHPCGATGQPIEDSALELENMLDVYAAQNPNTRLLVVGHSQGGLIALQAVNRFVAGDVTPGTEQLDAVVTLDGALGGTPDLETMLVDWAPWVCWGTEAANDLRAIWHSATDHFSQGSTAQSLAGTEHRELVTDARLAGLRVMTLGNNQDCVYTPLACLIPFKLNVSSQIVDTADWALMDLGGDCPATCISESHSRVLEHPTALDRVGAFLGSPTSN